MSYKNDTKGINGFDIVAFGSGDELQFKKVYDKLSKALLYFTSSIVEDITDSEDIVASAFLKLWRGKKELESYDHVKRWLYIIVKNEAIDKIRLKKREHKLEIELLSRQDEPDYIIDMELLKCCILSTMWEAIEDLPKKRRQVILLKYLKNKDTREIAQELDISPQTGLNHLSRGITQLHKVMEQKIAALM